MKQFLFCLVILLSTLKSFSQQTTTNGPIGFEYINLQFWMYRDTTVNANCIWQMGKPQKNLFTQAFGGNHVLVTDSLNPYPINDTSAFIIGQTADLGWSIPHFAALTGHYSVNADSLSDYGMVEISLNKGVSWINILEDTTYNFFWAGGKPVLTGNTNGWKFFQIDFTQLAIAANLNPGDTILTKFTFISDSLQTNKDGLMFDELFFYDFFEDINGLVNNISSKTLPNPAHDIIRIETNSNVYQNAILLVNNTLGRKVLEKQFSNNQKISLDIKDLPPGIYYYTGIFDNEKWTRGKIIKQ